MVRSPETGTEKAKTADLLPEQILLTCDVLKVLHLFTAYFVITAFVKKINLLQQLLWLRNFVLCLSDDRTIKFFLHIQSGIMLGSAFTWFIKLGVLTFAEGFGLTNSQESFKI
jgi:hypothetical protein